ncbi:shikimate dehydrogenase family protein [Acholeplasma hippikon]|uniref:Shikimate dehydrogenase n=1 Tax=Acholeplasma hippikon TaxID=264636 RepID=A0A449BKA5_9MOLU|nr:shikimate dehydrogenase [Acholeplasma hippikon]VEU82872.1 Shikimate dehydrogenase [Acholeplasma hippikon]
MKNFALIGKNIGHSISPFLHQEIARIYNLKLTYQILDLQTGGQLEEVIQKLKKKELHGANVTIPYKEDILIYLDDITYEAKQIGAINTIFLDNKIAVGANTDYNGLIGLIRHSKIHIKDKNVIILGTGGASKAALKVCKDLGANVTIVTRDKQNKTMHDKIITYNELDPLIYDVVINATPIGMFPNVDASPLKSEFVKDKIVIDLIYNPVETKMMKEAKIAIGGMDMLIIQAIQSESLWFKKKLEITDEIISELRSLCNEYIRNTF